jgi:hypothetical protein
MGKEMSPLQAIAVILTTTHPQYKPDKKIPTEPTTP